MSVRWQVILGSSGVRFYPAGWPERLQFVGFRVFAGRGLLHVWDDETVCRVLQREHGSFGALYGPSYAGELGMRLCVNAQMWPPSVLDNFGQSMSIDAESRCGPDKGFVKCPDEDTSRAVGYRVIFDDATDTKWIDFFVSSYCKRFGKNRWFSKWLAESHCASIPDASLDYWNYETCTVYFFASRRIGGPSATQRVFLATQRAFLATPHKVNPHGDASP